MYEGEKIGFAKVKIMILTRQDVSIADDVEVYLFIEKKMRRQMTCSPIKIQ